MKSVNNYKKCLCCGKTYNALGKDTHCSCGGFLYSMGTIYTPKTKAQ